MLSPIAALNALNFFMADVRDGLGPFLGVFLQKRGWSPAEIGLVMTVGGLAGMAATAPAGAFVDASTHKRALVVIAAAAVIAGSLTILLSPSFAVTAAAQICTGMAGAIIGPTIAGITLGLVGQGGFPHQLGRNEAFNHAGNVLAALTAGVLGYAFGLAAIFVLLTAMGAGSIASVLAIKTGAIDHAQARGLNTGSKGGKIPGLAVLLRSTPLILLAAILMLFHLANAAMLPLLGQSLSADGTGDPSAYTAAIIVIAQLTMIPMALLASRLAVSRGYKPIFLLALAALPVRGLLAAFATGPIGLLPVQILDGVGAGLLGVAVPGLVARILSGSGHVNAGLGAVMTVQGVGGALSPALAGGLGYASAFLMLATIAAVSLLLWLAARSTIRAADNTARSLVCDPRPATDSSGGES